MSRNFCKAIKLDKERRRLEKREAKAARKEARKSTAETPAIGLQEVVQCPAD